MANTINADNGVSSGSAGLKSSSDGTGILALQTNGTTAVTVDASQVVTLANALPVASGGTGVTTSTGSGSVVLGTSPTISGAVLNSMASSVITSGTSVSASGTSVNFTSIPSWVKRITVMFINVSSNGASMPTVRLGTSSGIEATGYSGSTQSGTSAVLISTGFDFAGTYQTAARLYHGAMTLTLQNSSTNTWAATAVIGLNDGASVLITGGSKSTASVLTQLRITFTNGTDTFDSGSINILYE